MDILIFVLSIIFLVRGKISWVLLGLLTLTTFYLGVGTNLSNILVAHNVSDVGLILYILLSYYLIKKRKNKFINAKLPFSKVVICFYLFLLISFIVDLTLNHGSISSILRTSRHWLFLSCVWTFIYVKPQEVYSLLKLLLYVSVALSVLILFQYFTNIGILPTGGTEFTTASGLIEKRGAGGTIFATFLIFLLLGGYFNLHTKYRYTFIGILSSVILLSMTRTYFFAFLVGILFMVIKKGSFNFKKIMMGLAFALCLMGMALSNEGFRDRILEGKEEVNRMGKSNDVEGNMSFRLLIASERMEYVSNKIQYSVFGIGNIHESEFRQVFKIGGPRSEGGVTQLDTGDIAWPLFFLRLGFVGTFIYLILYFRCLFFAFIRRQNVLSNALFVYLFIQLLFLSFASSSIANGSFWLLPILIISCLNRKIN